MTRMAGANWIAFKPGELVWLDVVSHAMLKMSFSQRSKLAT